MKNQDKKFNYLFAASFLISIILIIGSLIYGTGLKSFSNNQKDVNKNQAFSTADLEKQVIPSSGVELPIKWGNLGKQLTETGVIKKEEFETLYTQRGGLNNEQKNLLYGENNGNLVINSENSGFVLNMLWALGLGNKNKILENGPMADSRYGGAQNFASTAGWTLAEGGPMTHYNKHQFITLTPEQQALVEKVSKNIYRPCCDNSTYFPDCNHGMAMLGFLELAASQGANENELYGMALVLNSYWFPKNYQTIAQYFKNQGIDWNKINTQEVLGQNFSSVSGYQRILASIAPPAQKGGGSCGV